MPLILAIEPDRRQAAKVAASVRGRFDADLVLDASADLALPRLNGRVPDLVLTTALLSATDAAALAGWLRALGTGVAWVQTLTIPVLGSASPRKPRKKGGMLAALRRAPAEDTAAEGCDPAVFAEQIAGYLERAATERAELAELLELEEEPVTALEEPVALVEAAAAPVEEPVTLVDEPVALVEEAVALVEAAVAPVDEPIAPVERVEPAEPIVPVVLVEPVVLVAPFVSVEPFIPVEPFVPVEPVEVVERVVPVEPVVLAVPFVPLEPIEPVVQIEPVGPAVVVVPIVPLAHPEPVKPWIPQHSGLIGLWPALEGEVAAAPSQLPAPEQRSAPPELPAPLRQSERAEPLDLVDPRVPEWMEILESLRRDVETLRAAEHPKAPLEPLPPLVVPQPAPRMAKPAAVPQPMTRPVPLPVPPLAPPPATPQPALMRPKPKVRRRLPRGPVQDEWGVFDPEQCGFAALLAKLKEATLETIDEADVP